MRSNEELVKSYQSGDKKALIELIVANKGIIYKIANKYDGINRELEIDDLYQNGILGLIKAVEKYDLNYGKKAKFITYAVHYINRYITNIVNGTGSKEVENNKFYHQCTSLNKPIGEDEETELEEFVEDIDYSFENIEEKIFISSLRKELEEVMESANTLKQREILKMTFGWNSKPMTMNEIGEIFDISNTRVRDIKAAALKKIRHSSWAIRNVKEFAELGYINKFYLSIFRQWGLEV